MPRRKKITPKLIGTENDREIWQLPSGDTFSREKGQGPGTPWDELDYETQYNDLWALTIGGQKGTSAGDAWPGHLVDKAREIIGKEESITQQHINRFIDYMYDTGSLSYMSEHPGKMAFTEENFGKMMQMLALMAGRNPMWPR